MISNTPLPPEIENAISGEKVDFVLESSRFEARGETFHFLFFSLAWLAITLTVGGAFFIPLIL